MCHRSRLNLSRLSLDHMQILGLSNTLSIEVLVGDVVDLRVGLRHINRYLVRAVGVRVDRV